MKSLPKYGMSGKSRLERAIAEVYEEYQKTLRRSNSLDFDDLLVKGVQLFREHPSASSWCEYVLVDELYVFFPFLHCLIDSEMAR